MTVDEVLAHFGAKNDSDLASKLGVVRSAISQWRGSGIPLPRQARIQIMTKGKLKAELKPIPQAS